MPVTNTRIHCNRCKCSTLSGEVNAWRVFLHHGLSVPLRKTMAWCEQCDDLVGAEQFRDIDNIVAEMSGLVKQVAVLEQTLKNNYWQRLFNRKLRRIRRNRIETLLTLAAELDISKQRAYRAKCEDCGGLTHHTIDPSLGITKHYWLQHEQQSVATGLIHPNCGGEFIAKPELSTSAHAHIHQQLSTKPSADLAR